MERVVKRRDPAALAEAKARAIEQIERALAAFENKRAVELAASAVAEFPGDADIASLKERADEAAAKIAEAEKLLAQGCALCAQQWCDEGFEAMRKALALAPQYQPARTALVESLIERSRALLETDWRAAEPYVKEALELEPGNAIAKSLRTSVADHRRDEAVVKCFTLARAHRTAGRLDEALREAEQCFAQYPLDPRLQQLRDILKAELEKAQIATQRPADLQALREIQKSLEDAPGADAARDAHARAREIAARHNGDPEIGALVDAIAARAGEIAPALPEAPPVAAAAAAAAADSAPPPLFMDEPAPVPLPEADLFGSPEPAQPVPPAPMAAQRGEPGSQQSGGFTGGQPASGPGAPQDLPAPPAGQPPAAPPPAQQPPAPPQGQIPPAPPRHPRKPINRNVLWAGVGTAAVLALIAAAIALTRMSRGPSAGMVRLEVRTNPPGATIRVDGRVRGTSNFTLETAPGEFLVEAALEGYQTASTRAKAAPGAAPVEFTLEPLPQTIRLFTDLPDGTVVLDSQPPRELADGQAILDAVPPGTHTITISSRSGQATFNIEVAPGRAPSVTAPPVVKDVAALLVSNLGSTARVYSSAAPVQIDVDGQPAGEAGPDGLQVLNLAPGTHEIAAGQGTTQLKKIVEISPAPMLTAFLQSDRNIGTLVVLTGEDGVDVFIDGSRYRRQTSRGGQLRIPREPKQYRIRVAKSGFQDTPEQVVNLAKGEEKRVTFKLVPLPTTARLAFHGAAPGTQVFLDGSLIGTVGSDGGFQAGSVPPGEHTIELRSGGMRSRPVRKSFTAGQTIDLSAAEIAVRSVRGTLRLNITPANANVTVTRSGGSPVAVTGAEMELDEGSYTVTAKAEGYVQHSQHVQIAGGQTSQLDMTLVREQRRPRVVASGMEGWQTPWSKDGEWYWLKGAGMVQYKQASSPGVYAFNIMLGSGGGLFRGKDLEWFANYRDARNYVLFRLERTTLRRIVVENGKRTEYPKRAHNLDLRDGMMASVQVEVTDDVIVNRLKRGDSWVVADTYVARGGKLTAGQFGIHVIGNDEVRMSGFSFTPKE